MENEEYSENLIYFPCCRNSMPENFQEGKLIEKIQATKEVVILRVSLPNLQQKKSREYVAGQFFMLALPNQRNKSGFLVKKAYSVATCCPKHYDDYIEFCIRWYENGELSPKLAQLKIGDTILLDGPYGKFTINPKTKHDIVLLAGGTGVAPMMGFIRQMLNEQMNHQILLLYNAKTSNELLYKKELEEISNDVSNIKVVFALTQDGKANADVEKGRITLAMIKKYCKDKNLSNKEFYICGPVEMIRELKQALLDAGVEKSLVKIDVW